MGDGHVEEIEQCSVRASLPEGSRLSQFSGDLDQAIDLRHRAVLLMAIAATPPYAFQCGPIITRTPIKPL